MTPPFRRGDMVWSYFPFAETPDIPARTRHAAIIIGAFSATEASRMLGRPVPDYGVAVAVYTSFQVKKFGGNLPIGIIQVPLERAHQNKNNSAFFIDTRGLITSIDTGLFRRVMEEFARVNERAREQIVAAGPLWTR